MVEFSPAQIENLYILGFGDLLPDGSLDYVVKSNNGDILTVLSTVVEIVRNFTAQFPYIKIFFRGSTIERTKLYARILKMYHGEFRKEFKVSGLIGVSSSFAEVPFESQSAFEYFAFLIKKIE